MHALPESRQATVADSIPMRGPQKYRYLVVVFGAWIVPDLAHKIRHQDLRAVTLDVFRIYMEKIGIIFFSALGALIASFVTVVAERAYTGQSWRRGRSRCNSCRETLRARDLVPLASWLFARGRCRYCNVRLPALYMFVETAFAALFALSYLTLGLGAPLLVFLATLTVLGFTVLYDLRHTIVPLPGTILLFLGSLGFALLVHETMHDFLRTLLAAGGVGLFIFLIHALSRGRAMGLADVPTAFSLSLLVGAKLVFSGLLFSFWIGALFGIGILLLQRGGPTMGREVPFVPFLAAGFLLAYFTQWTPFLFFAL